MKKTVKTLLIVLFVLVSAISCVKDDPDGKWAKMKWQVPSSLVQVQEGIYQIPTSGGSFTLICENYKPWISSLTEIGSHVSKEYPGSCDSLQGEWCSVKCEKNDVIITFSPLADDDVHQFEITFTAGDIFHTLRFVQQHRL